MIVVTLTDCPPKLRGDLSKWLMEINTGVYVGKLSARVREELWKRICENISNGRATMVYSCNNEQGMSFHVHNTAWEPVDFEGLTLIRRPSAVSESDDGHKKSKAKTRLIAQRTTAARQKKQKQVGYVVIDVETTGLDSETDEIIELAAIRIIEHEIAEEFSVLVCPKRKIPETITELTGITQEMIDENGQDLPDAIQKFKEFIKTSVIVSHNISFDRAFLNTACRNLNLEKIINKGHDTLTLARRRVKGVDNYRLQTLARYFDFTADENHRALADCKLTYQLYEKLNEI